MAPISTTVGHSATITLTGTQPSLQNIGFLLVTAPTYGTLYSADMNTTYSTGDIIPSTVVLVPSPNGGGKPYSTFTYTVTDSLSVSSYNLQVSVSVLCDPGTYTDQGSRTCVTCPAGQIAPEASYNTQCAKCPEDTYQSGSSHTSCTACPAGTFQDTAGSTSCKSCAAYGYPTPCARPVVAPQEIAYSDGGSIALIIIAAVMMVISLLFAIALFIKRKTPVVKSASPVFCYLIILGLMFSYASIFVFVGTPTDFTCGIRPWLVGLALALVLGNLFAKTWRVYRIFEQSNFYAKVTVIENKSLLGFSFFMLCLELLIPLIWTAVDRPRPTLIQVNLDTSFHDCQSNNLSFQWAMVACFGIINFFVLAYGAFLAFKTRQVSSAFSESRYIGVCIYNMLVLGVVTIPVAYIAAAGFFTIFFVRAIAILLCTTFVLLVLFGNKIYIIFYRPDKNSLEYIKTFRNKKVHSTGENSSGGKSPSAKGANRQSAATGTTTSGDQATVLGGVINMKEESDSFTGLFSKTRWAPRFAILMPAYRSFGFREVAELDHTNSRFVYLEGAIVTTWDSEREFEITNPSSGWSYHLQFDNPEEYGQWLHNLRALCEVKKHKKHQPATVSKSTPRTVDEERPPSRLEQSALELGVELTSV